MANSSNSTISNRQIIKYPIITDKATRLLENNQYSFIVDRYSDKITIKSAIEYLFNVKVIKLNLKENILAIKGSVPGKSGNLVSIVPSE